MDTERLVEIEVDHPVLGLFHLDHIEEALKSASWGVHQEVKLLAGIARSDKANARVRMEAADRIRQIVKESAILSGYIQRLAMTHEQLTDAEGRTITSTRISGDRFLKGSTGSESTLAKLEAGVALHDKQPQLKAERRTRRLMPSTSVDPQPGDEPPQPGDENDGPTGSDESPTVGGSVRAIAAIRDTA